jgi:hypothetical protein
VYRYACNSSRRRALGPSPFARQEGLSTGRNWSLNIYLKRERRARRIRIVLGMQGGGGAGGAVAEAPPRRPPDDHGQRGVYPNGGEGPYRRIRIQVVTGMMRTKGGCLTGAGARRWSRRPSSSRKHSSLGQVAQKSALLSLFSCSSAEAAEELWAPKSTQLVAQAPRASLSRPFPSLQLRVRLSTSLASPCIFSRLRLDKQLHSYISARAWKLPPLHRRRVRRARVSRSSQSVETSSAKASIPLKY